MNSLQRIYVVFCLMAVTGCATQSPLSQLTSGDELSISAHQGDNLSDDITVSNNQVSHTTSDYTQKGLEASAAGCGMAAGLSIACAPFGALFGAAYGLFVGTFEQLTSDIDTETKADLLTQLNDYLRDEPLQSHLLLQLQEQASEHFVLVDTSAQNHVSVTIESIMLDSKDDNLSLTMSVAVTLTRMQEALPSQSTDHVYFHSDYYQLSDWLSGDAGFYHTLFNAAYTGLSYQIVSSIVRSEY